MIGLVIGLVLLGRERAARREIAMFEMVDEGGWNNRAGRSGKPEFIAEQRAIVIVGQVGVIEAEGANRCELLFERGERLDESEATDGNHEFGNMPGIRDDCLCNGAVVNNPSVRVGSEDHQPALETA